MKITAIRGRNIASLEGDFEIDFTKEPLVSSGLFAITGPTGAGKSTILDTLCLALYNNTPRLAGARENGVKIQDVGNESFAQNDTKNLLRRGAVDGYAEAEFIAVNGSTYRSRWSVERAYKKNSGKIKDSKLQLYNLSENYEEQGTKSELQKKIIELTGLSFEQFTRAVLLAQGDFATFLKSAEKEKADLLEKITGTEIYSLISQSIYNKAKESRENYSCIESGIAHIVQLSDEELQNLRAEQTELEQIITQTRESLTILQKQIDWHDDYKHTVTAKNEAEINLQKAKKYRDEASNRYTRMQQYDLVQNIRDTYTELTQNTTSLDNEQKSIAKNQNTLIDIEKKLADAQEIRNKAINDFKKLKTDWDSKEEERKKARSLDTLIATYDTAYKRADQTHTRDKNALEDEQKKLASTIANTQQCTKELEDLNFWFEKRIAFESLVAHSEIIVGNLATLNSETENLKLYIEQQSSLKDAIQAEQKTLDALKTNLERLNQLAPKEIYTLRASLVEGEPCPVCGNTHHLFTTEIIESVEMQELEKQKEEIRKTLEDTSQLLEKQKAEYIEIQTKVDITQQNRARYQQQLDNELHGIIPNWSNEKNLQERLHKLVTDWNEKKSLLEQKKNHITNNQEKIKDITESIKKFEFIEKTSLEELQNIEKGLLGTRKERADILDGKNIDILTQEYETASRTAQNKIEETTTIYSETDKEREKLKGTITQQQQAIATLENKITAGTQAIEQWLTATPSIDWNRLSDLLSYSTEYIAQEKQELALIKEQVTTGQTLLLERNESLSRLLSQSYRPSDSDTRETLTLAYHEKETLYNQSNERIAIIKTTFENDNKNKKHIAQVNKKLDLLRPEKEAWARLNDLFGSADGAKFRRIAQGYTLDRLLIYANIHLQELSERYTLQRIPGMLALQVIDNNMLGETRSVHTLSGGESFLISLALALGLSSLSSYRMSIESLFIDEGFGSLDADTLRISMDALERLQIHGRKIGVISHVAEMTERIPVQIQVTRRGNNHSHIDIVG